MHFPTLHLRLPGCLVLVSAFMVAPAFGNDMVRSQYAGSDNLPDEIAYLQFLEQVLPDATMDEHQRLELIARAVGYDLHTANGTNGAVEARAARLSNHFKRSYDLVEREKDRAAADLICRSRDTISVDRVFTSLNAVEDIGESAAAKRYQVTLNRLRPAERDAFKYWIDELKRGMAYVKLDNRRYHEANNAGLGDADREALIRSQMTEYCAGLDARLAIKP